MKPLLSKTEHRPWPLPDSPWQWRQSWNDLLFVHYRIEKSKLEHLIPKTLEIQEFDGSSWIGIVPFRMNNVMKRPFPNLPWFSHFLELNVRLYVIRDGKPGVWFLSLDATNPLVVWGGRKFYNVPYRNARIDMKSTTNHVHFKSICTDDKNSEKFEVKYQFEPDTSYAKRESLEYFLTERYCFYSQSAGDLYRTDVHHLPWTLQNAKAQVLENSLATGLIWDSQSQLTHFSKGVDVVSWSPKKLI